jgi:hypothetical protein
VTYRDDGGASGGGREMELTVGLPGVATAGECEVTLERWSEAGGERGGGGGGGGDASQAPVSASASSSGGGDAVVRSSLHSRVSVGYMHHPDCHSQVSVGYMDHTGCHKLSVF